MIVALSGVIVDGTTPVTATPTAQALSIPQGTDATINLTVTGSNGTAIDVTGYSFTLSIKLPTALATAVATLTGTVTDGPAGKVSFTLPGSTTKIAPIPATLNYPAVGAGLYGDYVFDVFSSDASGHRDEVVPESTFTVTWAPGA